MPDITVTKSVRVLDVRSHDALDRDFNEPMVRFTRIPDDSSDIPASVAIRWDDWVDLGEPHARLPHKNHSQPHQQYPHQQPHRVPGHPHAGNHRDHTHQTNHERDLTHHNLQSPDTPPR